MATPNLRYRATSPEAPRQHHGLLGKLTAINQKHSTYQQTYGLIPSILHLSLMAFNYLRTVISHLRRKTPSLENISHLFSEHTSLSTRFTYTAIPTSNRLDTAHSIQTVLKSKFSSLLLNKQNSRYSSTLSSTYSILV